MEDLQEEQKYEKEEVNSTIQASTIENKYSPFFYESDYENDDSESSEEYIPYKKRN
jgi:hypothetical protein